MKKQDFKVLKTKDLYPFPDNPFHVAEDETLSELAESIKEFGIVTPIITRPKEDGDGYEVIAGQRRVRASELAGINTVPAFVLPLDRDRAIITLVDSNLQRENILPSERAFAYKMKSEAMKRQGFRTDLTSSQVVTKLRTDDCQVLFRNKFISISGVKARNRFLCFSVPAGNDRIWICKKRFDPSIPNK